MSHDRCLRNVLQYLARIRNISPIKNVIRYWPDLIIFRLVIRRHIDLAATSKYDEVHIFRIPWAHLAATGGFLLLPPIVWGNQIVIVVILHSDDEFFFVKNRRQFWCRQKIFVRTHFRKITPMNVIDSSMLLARFFGNLVENMWLNGNAWKSRNSFVSLVHSVIFSLEKRSRVTGQAFEVLTDAACAYLVK